MVSAKRVLLDTSVLAGAFSPTDAHHERCKRVLHSMRSEGFVVLPVIVELVALLRRDGLDPEPFVERMSERRGLHAVSIGQEELAPISLWMKKYRDIKPDFADASIVHVAEREKIETVLTLDDDFRVYRTSAGKALRVLPREEQ